MNRYEVSSTHTCHSLYKPPPKPPSLDSSIVSDVSPVPGDNGEQELRLDPSGDCWNHIQLIHITLFCIINTFWGFSLRHLLFPAQGSLQEQSGNVGARKTILKTVPGDSLRPFRDPLSRQNPKKLTLPSWADIKILLPSHQRRSLHCPLVASLAAAVWGWLTPDHLLSFFSSIFLALKLFSVRHEESLLSLGYTRYWTLLFWGNVGQIPSCWMGGWLDSTT